MVKVYLVEDEIIIRQSIKNSIDWEKEGYEFVGDASDGELALPVILKEKPDILITDLVCRLLLEKKNIGHWAQA